MPSPLIPARSDSALKKPQSASSSTSFRVKRLAPSNPAANLVTIARCAARAGFDAQAHWPAKPTILKRVAIDDGHPFLILNYYKSFYFFSPLFWFGRKLLASIFGTCFAASSALKNGSSLKPNSFAEITVGNL